MACVYLNLIYGSGFVQRGWPAGDEAGVKATRAREDDDERDGNEGRRRRRVAEGEGRHSWGGGEGKGLDSWEREGATGRGEGATAAMEGRAPAGGLWRRRMDASGEGKGGGKIPLSCNDRGWIIFLELTILATHSDCTG
ncbi:UNVERIFIED_CONTAM: hypothetical protein Slati_3884500 [Sesamum latifolium]|uniref:Uncharacterized protein n=1 Tax=Sesamum latifolium TaxID=2727402 RepID=A0AAW2TQ65_9LAMI